MDYELFVPCLILSDVNKLTCQVPEAASKDDTLTLRKKTNKNILNI